MNWKINYWTLIAAIMAGSFIFSCMDTNIAAQAKWKKQINQIDQNVDSVLDILTAETDCDTANITLPVGKAFQEISKFSLWSQQTRKVLKEAKRTDLLPVNFGTSPFLLMKLPKCETIRMFEAAPEGEVNLYLTLADNPEKEGGKMLSAVFATSNFISEQGEINETVAGGSTFFDFVSPCPPRCQN